MENAVELAKEYNADIKIVELGALLHDIVMPSELGSRQEHNVYGVKIADADVIAHFDCIPSLFHLVYNEMNLSVEDGEECLKKKLERDYNKLSDRTREIIKDRYENIIKVLFVNK